MEKHIYGYGFDFWIWCVGQKMPEDNLPTYGKLMWEAWPYSEFGSHGLSFRDIYGVQYSITSKSNEHGGTVFVKEIPQVQNHYFSVPWRDEAETRDIRNITIDAEYRNILIKAINYIIEKSPFRKIYLQIRCQGLDLDNVIGVLTVKQLEKLINDDELLGNVVYVICNSIDF